ncbi:hypothetical protein [Mucilaginibacter agri]|uniref:Uncharacterized protein n=1 Tax=Mucilaginibacter agri TaxID=2695265 RepID=A0A965ZII1_9SPHI|nr:hypothetical protein [Mucilaginibacter agri]NCD70352.1 hypothetical protein [Mucilaginibacter agri]
MFKKRNIVSKLFLKFTDTPKYKAYKWDLTNYKNTNFAESLKGSGRINSLDKIKLLSEAAGELNLIHSGHAGDIIYALATIKRIHELTGAAINLYFKLGREVNLPNYGSHPVGNVMLNQKMADMLIPLVSSQPYISTCEVYQNQEVQIDLDYFRAGLIHQDKGNIARWCGYITGVNPQLYKSWLRVQPDINYADSIIIARSMRYQNTSISYSFLNNYKNLKFIGVAEEYEAMKVILPQIEWIKGNDFLQLSQIIAGCKFFIGNQSFPYSLAEALKVPRILEVAFEVINVVPEGDNAYDFLFQDHFESVVKLLDNASPQ